MAKCYDNDIVWSCGHYQYIKKRHMMASSDEADIQQIVEKVLKQMMGLSQPASAPNQTVLLPSSGEIEEKSQPEKVVVIGSDHGGYDLKEILKTDLNEMGFKTRDVGTNNKEAVDYPDFAHEVARLVSSGEAWRGIMIDGAGIGSCIVANKVPGVRAGMSYDYSSALNSREHNDTNVLTLGAGLIGTTLAKMIVKTWLNTEFGGQRHARRVEKITSVERQYLKQG
jgi:ribose 5-phosphate isomerase B